MKNALAVYERGLRDVVRDGIVSQNEALDLKRVQDRLGLTDTDTLDMRANAFAWVNMTAMESNRDDLLEANQHLLELFGLEASNHPVVSSTCRRLAIYYGMKLILNGQLPIQLDSDVNLDDDEVSHLELPCRLMEERTVSSGWVSGSSGVSFRVAKGVSFRVGGTRGHRVSQRAIVPVSYGLLAITNKRIAYLGNPKSFESKWNRILGIEPYSDGLTLYFSNRSKAPTLVYEHPEYAELVAAICSYHLS